MDNILLQTTLPKGTFKRGDRHPWAYDRFYSCWRNHCRHKESWISESELDAIRAKDQQSTMEKARKAGRRSRWYCGTHLPIGYFSRGDPHPYMHGKVFWAYRLGGECWVGFKRFNQKRKHDLLVHRKHKDKVRANQRKWYRENRGYAAHKSRVRQGYIKKNASLGDYFKEEINDIYKTAAAMIDMHVDHIMPVSPQKIVFYGKRQKPFSGLHVPWNLQIIPSWANLAKGNRCLE